MILTCSSFNKRNWTHRLGLCPFGSKKSRLEGKKGEEKEEEVGVECSVSTLKTQQDALNVSE